MPATRSGGRTRGRVPRTGCQRQPTLELRRIRRMVHVCPELRRSIFVISRPCDRRSRSRGLARADLGLGERCVEVVPQRRPASPLADGCIGLLHSPLTRFPNRSMPKPDGGGSFLALSLSRCWRCLCTAAGAGYGSPVRTAGVVVAVMVGLLVPACSSEPSEPKTTVDAAACVDGEVVVALPPEAVERADRIDPRPPLGHALIVTSSTEAAARALGEETRDELIVLGTDGLSTVLPLDGRSIIYLFGDDAGRVAGSCRFTPTIRQRFEIVSITPAQASD